MEVSNILSLKFLKYPKANWSENFGSIPAELGTQRSVGRLTLDVDAKWIYW